MTGAGPRVVDGLEALAALEGATLGPGPWLAIDQARIQAFADATDDHQWIHVDAERAAAGPFGASIAHGYLTLSLCSRFLEELLEVRGVAMAVNYGLDRVRFPSPVPAGARIRASGEVTSAEPVTGGVQLVVCLTVQADGAPKPSCVAEVVVRFYG